jgi:uncharacterized protein with NRDE domain
MCLIAFSWKSFPGHKLILVTNRDEYFERPSMPLHLWDQGFYSGKDLRAGGTWLGLHPNGRFAAITNYRNMRKADPNTKSRGNLVKKFLEGDQDPYTFLTQVAEEIEAYEGFNLLVSDGDQLFYFSNKGSQIQELEPGIYGLSNHLLNTPWPKLTLATGELVNKLNKACLDPIELMQVVHSRSLAKDEELPDTGLDFELERQVSAQFISVGGYYGTVNTTVVLWENSGKVIMFERTFDQPKHTHSDHKVEFTAMPA